MRFVGGFPSYPQRIGLFPMIFHVAMQASPGWFLGTVGRSHGLDPEPRLSSSSTLVPSLDEANLLRTYLHEAPK